MRRLLIPDAGPLFSLAAGDLLHLLERFSVGISDVIRWETIDRGLGPNPSPEAKRLLDYYNRNSANITTFETQVGVQIAALRAKDKNYTPPRNTGELSIQSLLIDLQINAPGSNPVVLFEDGWFLANAPSLAKPCILLSTQAFLEIAQKEMWIKSAEAARQAIATVRPSAHNTSMTIPIGAP
jgi:hypothetical protein